MTHIYPCYFCKKTACDLTSLQYHSTPMLGRFGIDIYDCADCGRRYYFEIMDEHGSADNKKEPIQTRATRQELMWRVFSRIIFDASINGTNMEEELAEIHSVLWQIAKEKKGEKK